MNQLIDTIAAIATPFGRGGIGIIRISGPDAKKIATQLLHQSLPSREAVFTSFYDKNGEIIDEGIALFFPAPNSYTGEDVLELQGHGGPIVMNRLLKEVLSVGARMAKAGEFTERAFLNNKMDLTQAEAVADLIDASSEQAARSALRSLQGEFSKKIQTLLEALIHLRMMVEAAIDFPEEEIDFLSDLSVKEKLNALADNIEKTILTAKQGALLQQGMTVAIIGKPNAGKSSLLNCLSERDSAIVTEIAGTTRDLLRENIHIDGLPIHIIDTAGLRESDDAIEQEGMRRTWKAVETADVILMMIDGHQEKIEAPSLTTKKPIVIIKNKIDLTNELPSKEKWKNHTMIKISAKHQLGIDELKNHLKALAGFSVGSENTFIARTRHCEALHRAQQHLSNGITQLESHHAGELLAEDLRQAQQALSEITGKFTADDLLSRIFSSFCIGK